MDRDAKRESLGYGDDDFLLLTVAEMTPNKNHITILKALSLLKERGELGKIHYLICGRGEMWASLEQSAKDQGISDHVNFLGYRTDAAELYKASDLFAFVTFREGLSVALMEAMSSGIPIVCAKIRGNVDLIDDNVSGIFSDNNPEAVAKHILHLHRNPEFRQALGQAASEKVLMCDDKNVLEQVKNIYLSV
jgi:glycosyltransferase EpsD